MSKFLYDFSFVVPVYNCEKYISKCVKSVLSQKYDINKIQIILINDGSTDDSLKICTNFKRENVIIISQKNKGVSFSRNCGIKKAQGKYIVFLDSDDFVSENYCIELFNYFEKHQEVDLVSTRLVNYINKTVSGHFRYSKIYPKENSIIDIYKNPDLIQTTINICVKNEIAKKVLFDLNMKFSEDEKFNTQIILKTGMYGYCPNAIYYYRKNNTSATNIYNIKEDVFESYTNYYVGLFKKYGDIQYIKNLFLNTLRWRINESKLISNNKRDINVIKSILKKIEVNDILDLSYLSLPIILSILELKNIKYSFDCIDNRFILSVGKVSKDFTKKCHFVISKLLFDNNPTISGTINFPIKQLEYKTDDFEFVAKCINLYSESTINNVLEYKYNLKVKQIPAIIHLNFIDGNINITHKTYSCGLKYRIDVNDKTIYVKKLSLSQKIKKIKSKFLK